MNPRKKDKRPELLGLTRDDNKKKMKKTMVAITAISAQKTSLCLETFLMQILYFYTLFLETDVVPRHRIILYILYYKLLNYATLL